MILTYESLGIIGMFVGALLLLSFGYSVAFSLGGVSIIFGLIGIVLQELNPDQAIFDWGLASLMPDRIFGIMNKKIFERSTFTLS